MVIYLHSNSGSRLESVNIRDALLHQNVEVVTLDLGGSGLSDGEYVSLGHHEQYDLHQLLLYLEPNRCPIYLFGRSMGAVTSLLYLANPLFHSTQTRI